MNVPYKRVQRIQNPFNSEDSNNTNQNYQHMQYNNNNNNNNKYFSNVFQYNDRSKVTLSDSQNSSCISHSQSGENIYTFSKQPRPELVQQIDAYDQQINFKHISNKIPHPNNQNHNIKVQQSLSSDSYHSENLQQDIRFSFKPISQYTSPETKNIVESKYVYSTNIPNQYQNQSQQNNQKSNPHQVSFDYRSPQTSKFNLNWSNKHNLDVSNKHNLDLSHKHNFNCSTTYTGTTEMQNLGRQSNSTVSNFQKTFVSNNTFKPSILIGKRNNSSSLSKQNLSPKGIHIMTQKRIPYKIQKQNLHKINNDYLQLKSNNISLSKYSNEQQQQQQQVQIQQLQVYQAEKSLIIPKYNILQSLKHDLSKGNEIQKQYQYNSNLINDLKIKQIQNLNKNKNKNKNNQENNQIVTSHFYVDNSKKKRKKIFSDKQKYQIHINKINHDIHYNKQSNLTQNNHILHKNHIQNNDLHQNIGCPHTKCLIKSLQIIDKLSTPQQKPFINPSQIKKQLIHSQYQNKNNKLSLSKQNEQLRLRQQILETNFEIINFETLFDLQQFDGKQSYQKLLQLNQGSINLFDQYKQIVLKESKIEGQKVMVMQNNNIKNIKYKEQVLNIRQKVSKLIKWHQKYVQTKSILQKLQQQIKQVLLLSSQQKYKKIKLLNQVINVLEKTQTYLQLQNKTIPTMIKNYIKKQKIMIQQLRQWLKNCFRTKNKK